MEPIPNHSHPWTSDHTSDLADMPFGWQWGDRNVPASDSTSRASDDASEATEDTFMAPVAMQIELTGSYGRLACSSHLKVRVLARRSNIDQTGCVLL